MCLLAWLTPHLAAEYFFENRAADGSLNMAIDGDGNLTCDGPLTVGDTTMTDTGAYDWIFIDTNVKARLDDTGLRIRGSLYPNGTNGGPSNLHPFFVYGTNSLLMSVDSSGNMYLAGEYYLVLDPQSFDDPSDLPLMSAAGSQPAQWSTYIQPESRRTIKKISEITDVAAWRTQYQGSYPTNTPQSYNEYAYDGVGSDYNSGLTNDYAKFSAVNSDGTLALVRFPDGYVGIYNLQSSAFQRILAHTQANGINNDVNEPRWSRRANEEEMIVYHHGNSFYEVDASDRFDVGASIGTITPPAPYNNYNVTFAGGEGDWDDSGRYFAVRLQSGASYAIGVFDRNAGDVLNGIIPVLGNYNAIDISPSGTWMAVLPHQDEDLALNNRFYRISDLANGTTTNPVYVDSEINASNDDFRSIGHNGWALDADGNEVLVYQDNRDPEECLKYFDPAVTSTGPLNRFLGTGPTVTYGVSTDILQLDVDLDFFSAQGTINNHIGRLSHPDKPGWLFMSTYMLYDKTDRPLANDLLMMEVKPRDANPRIWYVVDNHNDYRSGAYFTEAFAALSNDGNSIYYAGNWNSTDNLELYEVKLPADWADVLAQ